MIATLVFTAIAIVCAGLVARAQQSTAGLDERQRFLIVLAAAIGAILGAYGLQWPADHFGWSWLPVGVAREALPFGGRTVLGGLLGGWLAVELAKWRLGVRVATGDAFAAPLAVALAIGRLGCGWSGCCAGRECADAWYAVHDAAGAARLPVQLVEALFHLVAAAWAWWAGQRDRWQGRRLAAYLAAYAIVRFALELARPNRPLVLGCNWYQLLAIALFVVASGTWWRRRPGQCGNVTIDRPSRSTGS